MQNTPTTVLSSLESKMKESDQTQGISCNESQECFHKKKELFTNLDQDEETETSSLLGCNFIKKRLQHRCFPVNIAKFLRTFILQNTSDDYSCTHFGSQTNPWCNTSEL